jgi:hypothetical protein
MTDLCYSFVHCTAESIRRRCPAQGQSASGFSIYAALRGRQKGFFSGFALPFCFACLPIAPAFRRTVCWLSGPVVGSGFLFTGGAGECANVPLRAAAVAFFRFAGKK